MASIFSVTIDAGVLAVPQADCTDDNEVYRYIDTLLDWKKLLDEPWVAIYMREGALASLADDDSYPSRPQLKELFSAHRVKEYDVNTVATIVNRLLEVTPSFETHYQLVNVLPDLLEIEPDILKLTTSDALKEDLARCVVLIAILLKHCSQPLGGHFLILRNVPRDIIKVKAQIYDLEHNRNDIADLPSLHKVFEGDVLVCDDFRGLVKHLDESTVLVRASDDLGIELAIRIAVFKYALRQGEEPDWGNSLVPNIGNEFREKCQRLCSKQDDSLPRKILRSIVETIKGDNMRDVHAIRIKSGGSSPQRKRGLDKAQRRDIDREFHLHYWECADGTIELASVVNHNDFSIPE
ncbi:MAG: hypothetical protein OXC97_07960 [Candidatus Dadabacteria bacterium]|nr:hypothetical protein [Candidatus Dadabacteria bacterium]